MRTKTPDLLQGCWIALMIEAIYFHDLEVMDRLTSDRTSELYTEETKEIIFTMYIEYKKLCEEEKPS